MQRSLSDEVYALVFSLEGLWYGFILTVGLSVATVLAAAILPMDRMLAVGILIGLWEGYLDYVVYWLCHHFETVRFIFKVLGLVSLNAVSIAAAAGAKGTSLALPLALFALGVLIFDLILLAVWAYRGIREMIDGWRVATHVPYPTGHSGLYWPIGFENHYNMGYPVAVDGTMPGREEDCPVCRQAQQPGSTNRFAVHPKPSWEP